MNQPRKTCVNALQIYKATESLREVVDQSRTVQLVALLVPNCHNKQMLAALAQTMIATYPKFTFGELKPLVLYIAIIAYTTQASFSFRSCIYCQL